MLCWWLFGVLLLVPTLAHAEFLVCGDGPRQPCAATVGLTNVHPSSDPSTVTDPLCHVVPEAQIEAQRTLIQTVRDSHPDGRCHLKVVSNLAAEMTQAEKDAVNTALALARQPAADNANEIATNPLCVSQVLADVTAKVEQVFGNNATDLTTAYDANQTEISGATNLATLQAALLASNTRTKQAHLSVNTRLKNTINQLARCVVAHTAQ